MFTEEAPFPIYNSAEYGMHSLPMILDVNILRLWNVLYYPNIRNSLLQYDIGLV